MLIIGNIFKNNLTLVTTGLIAPVIGYLLNGLTIVILPQCKQAQQINLK